ncbi:hypothetical protein A2160_05870 [Candidatus Beckwithbacteria bacterium RBG_13_42_9]|uniref:DUF3307 domain-containing protein n=1 Tax=Candidatus Beckwithbacteria bacterium RBG_13_42_9 TaxID=1797457 RepID=A0A1F5E599_9BACT|nr:MAG: hypothetical protein A2160_05870 [Candidatus Beckwithbacteria bacterium RBG_13_42_9]
MLTTPHVLLGIFLVTKLPPVIGLPLALISHFAIDFLIPHWNPHLFTEIKKAGHLSQKTLMVIAVDGFLAVVAVGLFSFNPQFSIFPALAAVLATLPDWVEIPYYFLGFKNKTLIKYVTFEHNHQAKAEFFWGMVTQLFISGACLWFLLK